MKTIFLSILFLSYIHTARPDELIEMQLLKLNSISDMIYAFKRCAGVSLVVSGEAIHYDDDELNDRLNNMYKFFSLSAIKLARDPNGGADSIKKVTAITMNDITSLTIDYKNIINRSRNDAGKPIPDIVTNDTKMCGVVYDKSNDIRSRIIE